MTDTGIGIAEKDQDKALAPFGQVDGDLNRKYEGTGLGLPLTKALVKMHGGTFRLDSVPNVGSTVQIRFPTNRLVEQPLAAPSADDLNKRKAAG